MTGAPTFENLNDRIRRIVREEAAQVSESAAERLNAIYRASCVAEFIIDAPIPPPPAPKTPRHSGPRNG